MQTQYSFRTPLPLLIALAVLAMPLPSAAEAVHDLESAATQYQIDSKQSWLRVLVYRGGLLGGLGHNHVVSHDGITGSAALGSDVTAGVFSLQLDVADFSVDDSDARVSEGEDFPGEISAKDIAGTSKNMLGRKLLDGDNFPTIKIRSVSVSGALPDIEIETIVSLRGRDLLLSIPATISVANDTLSAMGEFSVTHRELGLSPFKAALGALRVRDELVIKFKLHGSKIDAESDSITQ